MDDHGVMGHAHPSGEFQVIIPDMIPSEEPITVLRDVTDVFIPNVLLSTRD
jgi:hypothetical protein